MGPGAIEAQSTRTGVLAGPSARRDYRAVPAINMDIAMSRMPLLDPATAPAASKPILEGIARKRGYVPTPVQVMAHSPVTLEGYVALATALARGTLSEPDRERVAIAIAAANECQPCLTAHTKIGKAAGLSDNEATAARAFSSAEPQPSAILALTKAINATSGHITDAELAAARAAGISDAAIVEIAGHIALNLLTNLANSIAGVKVPA